MRPDDDLQLGRQVKRARLRQRLASGVHHISVEWYPGLSEAVRGLEKNIFSGFGYRISFAVLGSSGSWRCFYFRLQVSCWHPAGQLQRLLYPSF